jgi:two-component system, OmpR family, response regulator RpaA
MHYTLNGALIMKVLIVDDNADFRALMKRMLVQLGHEVSEASNGIKGQTAALNCQPDAILMDLMMPIQDGFVTCQNLRRAGYEGQIIVISALAGVWSDLRTKIPEADGFLAKPITLNVLEDSLQAPVKVTNRKVTIESLRESA